MRINFHSKVGSHLNKYNKEPLIRTWVLHPASSSVWGSCHRPQSLCCGTGTGTRTPEAQAAAIAHPELWLSACCYLTAKSMRFIGCFSFPPNTICHSCSLAFQKLLLVFGQTFHSFSPLLAAKPSGASGEPQRPELANTFAGFQCDLDKLHWQARWWLWLPPKKLFFFFCLISLSSERGVTIFYNIRLIFTSGKVQMLFFAHWKQGVS